MTTNASRLGRGKRRKLKGPFQPNFLFVISDTTAIPLEVNLKLGQFMCPCKCDLKLASIKRHVMSLGDRPGCPWANESALNIPDLKTFSRRYDESDTRSEEDETSNGDNMETTKALDPVKFAIQALEDTIQHLNKFNPNASLERRSRPGAYECSEKTRNDSNKRSLDEKIQHTLVPDPETIQEL